MKRLIPIVAGVVLWWPATAAAHPRHHHHKPAPPAIATPLAVRLATTDAEYHQAPAPAVPLAVCAEQAKRKTDEAHREALEAQLATEARASDDDSE